MVQPQLTDYISSQMKLGVARQAIKSALVGAGWAEADVEDTLKKVEAGNRPASPAASVPGMSMPGRGGPEPKSIRVSDLISASVGPAAGGASGPTPSLSSVSAKSSVNKSKPEIAAPGRRPAMKIVNWAAIVLLAGLAGFFYWQNRALSGGAAKVMGEGARVASRVATLTGQVQALAASTTALEASIAALTAENAELRANLSFAAIPPLSAGAPASETVSISGKLAGGKPSFTLTTPYGVLVFVQNAKVAKVSAALTPLLTSTSSVTLTGTHVPGSQNITVTGVNGTPL